METEELSTSPPSPFSQTDDIESSIAAELERMQATFEQQEQESDSDNETDPSSPTEDDMPLTTDEAAGHPHAEEERRQRMNAEHHRNAEMQSLQRVIERRYPDSKSALEAMAQVMKAKRAAALRAQLEREQYQPAYGDGERNLRRSSRFVGEGNELSWSKNEEDGGEMNGVSVEALGMHKSDDGVVGLGISAEMSPDDSVSKVGEKGQSEEIEDDENEFDFVDDGQEEINDLDVIALEGDMGQVETREGANT